MQKTLTTCVLTLAIFSFTTLSAQTANMKTTVPKTTTTLSVSSKPLFTQTLRIGSKGTEVLNLQKILNSDPDTQIAKSGPGSPGNESTYFGLATAKALIKFQNKYKKETLTPAGLKQGTGVTGALTRAKLNTLAITPTPPKLFTKTLRPGMTDPEVKKLQTILALDGSLYPERTISGTYDFYTTQAVKRFQDKYNLTTPEEKKTIEYGSVSTKTADMLAKVFTLKIATAPIAITTTSTPTQTTSAPVSTPAPQPIFSFSGGGGGGDNPPPTTQTTPPPTQTPQTPPIITTPTTHTITASSGANGAISPSGTVQVNQGTSQTFTFTPSSNYQVDSITVDGGTVSPQPSYTFPNVQGPHSISVAFAPIPAPPAGTSPITLPPSNTIPARTSGVAPLSVFFDATATTDPTVTTRPFHEIEYRWNFGDPAGSPVLGTTWQTGSNPGVNSRNEAMGPVAAHVFEPTFAQGEQFKTFTVTLTAFDGTNTNATTTQITVENPDVYFAGANTICVGATVLPVAGVGGCPANAAATSTANFTNVINTYAKTGKRVLFQRGDTFITNPVLWSYARITTTGPGTVGAFGVGANPIIQASYSIPAITLSDQSTPNGTYHLRDWRIMDMEFIGMDAVGSSAIVFGGGIDQVTLLRLSASKQGVSFSASVEALNSPNNDINFVNPNNHGHTIWDQISVVDSTVNGTATSSPGATMFLGGDRMYFAGNSLDEGGVAQATPSIATHVIRLWYLGKGVVNNNTLQRAGPGQATIKLHGPTWCEDPLSPPGVLQPPMPLCNYSTDAPSPLIVTTYGAGAGYTRWVVLSDNKYVSAYNAGQIHIQAQNGSRHEELKDIITERNLYVAGANAFPHELIIDGTDITVRNEIFYSSLGSVNMAGVWIYKDGKTSVVPSRVNVYNNSFYNGYSGTSSYAPAVRVHSTSTDITIKNNIYSAPLAPVATRTISCDKYLAGGAVDCATIPGFVQSNNSTDNSVSGQVKIGNPFVVSVPASISDFLLSLTSYARNAGIPVPVWSDFFKNLRQDGAIDMGAVER